MQFIGEKTKKEVGDVWGLNLEFVWEKIKIKRKHLS